MPDGSMPIAFFVDLVTRADRDHGAIAAMAYAAHLSDASAATIVDRALDAAIDDFIDLYEKVYGEKPTQVSPQIRADARAALLMVGWGAREEKQQADMQFDQQIWRGAAKHEERLS